MIEPTEADFLIAEGAPAIRCWPTSIARAFGGSADARLPVRKERPRELF